MIRYSRSFFISLLTHLLFLVSLFYLYKYVSAILSNKKCEKRVCINLKCFNSHKEKVIEEKIVTQKQKIHHKKIIKKKLKFKKKVIKTHQKKIPQVVIVQKQILKKPIKKVEPSIPIEKTKELAAVVEKEEIISPQKSYLDENINKITVLLKENLYYPRRARKRSIQGKVVIRFKLSKEAIVSSIEIISSSHDILSRAAVETIESLSGKFPHPKEELIISVPIPYHLK